MRQRQASHPTAHHTEGDGDEQGTKQTTEEVLYEDNKINEEMLRVHITRDLKGEFDEDWYETVEAEVKLLTEQEWHIISINQVS